MVALSLNSIDFVGGQPALRYKFYDHNITAISPTGGPVRGGTRVTVSGVAFDAFNGEPHDQTLTLSLAQALTLTLTLARILIRARSRGA